MILWIIIRFKVKLLFPLWQGKHAQGPPRDHSGCFVAADETCINLLFLPGALRFLLGSLSLASSLGFGGFHCVLGRPAAQVMNLKGLMNTDCVSSPQNKWYDVSYMNSTSALEVTCWKAQNCHLPAFPVLRSNQQKQLCVRPHLLSNVSSYYWSSEDWVWKSLKFINS